MTRPPHNPDALLRAVGWREWLALPELGIPAIKVKVDTGARSSALHAASLDLFERHSQPWVRFVMHPARKRRDIEITAEAPVVDRRIVSDSGGNRMQRIFIRTLVRAGDESWPVDLNLSDRETMLFPMLLGRTAMAGRLRVDPAASYLLGRPSKGLSVEYPRRNVHPERIHP